MRQIRDKQAKIADFLKNPLRVYNIVSIANVNTNRKVIILVPSKSLIQLSLVLNRFQHHSFLFYWLREANNLRKSFKTVSEKFGFERVNILFIY